MTTKEKFLQGIRAKIKVLQDAYDYNKNLPDDVFETLNGNAVKLNNEIKSNELSDREYGANINTVRYLIEAHPEGCSKSELVKGFPDVKGDKYQIVTNALTALRLNGEIEKYKPKGKKMRGYYWRMKNIS